MNAVYDSRGWLLWVDHRDAMTYANVRALAYKSRQRCRLVTVGCVRYWHVSRAVGS